MKRAICLLLALIMLLPSVSIARSKEEIALLDALSKMLISQDEPDEVFIDSAYYDKERDMFVLSLMVDASSKDFEIVKKDSERLKIITTAIDDTAKLMMEMVKEFNVDVDVFVRMVGNDSVFLIGQKNLDSVEVDLTQATNTDAQKRTATLELYAAYLPVLKYSNTDNVKWDITYDRYLDAIVLQGTYNLSSKTWKYSEITKPEAIQNERKELKEVLISQTEEMQAELKEIGFPDAGVIMIVKTKDDYQIMKLVNGKEE